MTLPRPRLSMLQCLRLLALPAFFLLFSLSLTEARSVEFALTADWPTWPLSSLQEAAEYLANEVEGDESLLWTLVDTLERSPGRDRFDRAALAERFEMDDMDAVWALTLNETAGLLHPLSQNLLHLYLSLRAYSPALEMHRSLRKGKAFRAAVATAAAVEESGCDEGTSVSWAVISPGMGQREKVICDADKLEETLRTAAAAAAAVVMEEGGGTKEDTRVLSFDHVYPSSSSSSSAVVVTLYSTLGTSDFYSFHHRLASHAATGACTYVLRHFIPSSLPSSSSSSLPSSNKTVPTALQGYGMYLDIKNMEYKNIDDSPAPSGGGEGGKEGGQEQQQQQQQAIAIDEEVSGLLFPKLLAREPSLSTELRTLRSNLLEESSLPSSPSSVTNMKVWRLRDLGLQAAQTVATAKDPLRKLVDLSQNFPSHASRLSSLKVKEEFRQGALMGTQSHVLGYGTSLKPGHLFINGLPKPVTGAIFNVFDILKMLREEVQRLTALSSLPTSPAVQKQLVRLAATAGAAAAAQDGEEVRLDIYRGSRGALVYLNNLEKDARYRHWPSSLRQLVYPSWQLQALSRNLYTLTLVVDMADAASLKAVAIMRELYERTFPVRFSVLMVSKEGKWEEGGEEGVVGEVQEVVKGGKEGGREGAKATSAVVGMLFHHAKEEHGLAAAVEFLFNVGVGGGGGREEGGGVPTRLGTYGDVVRAYSGAVATAKKDRNRAADYVAEGWQALEEGKGGEGVCGMHRLVKDKGLPVGCFLLNGILSMGLDLDQGIMEMLGQEQQFLAGLVSQGRLKDSTKSVLGSVLRKGKGVYSRWCPWLEGERRRKAVSVMWLGGSGGAGAKLAHSGGSVEREKGAKEGGVWEEMQYLHPPGTGGEVKPLTVVMLADVGSRKGAESVQTLLGFLRAQGDEGRGEGEGEAVMAGGEIEKEEEEGGLGVRCVIVHTPPSSSSPSPLEKDGGVILDHLLNVVATASSSFPSALSVEEENARLHVLEKFAAFVTEDSSRSSSSSSSSSVYDIFLETLQADLEEGRGGGGGEAALLLQAAEGLKEEAREGIARADALQEAAERAILTRKALGVRLTPAGGEDGREEGVVLVVNGRHIFLGGKALHPLDVEIILSVETQTYTQHLLELFQPPPAAVAAAGAGAGAIVRRASDLIMMSHSFLNVYVRHPRVDIESHLDHIRDTPIESLLLDLQPPGKSSSSGSSSKGYSDEDDDVLSSLSITVLLDPLGEAAQRLSPLLTIFRDLLHLPIRLLLAPSPELTEFPLKSYYRFSLFPTRDSARVLFQALPPSLVLTTRVDTPESWNVQTKRAVQDLDNIKCEEIEEGGEGGKKGVVVLCGDREGSTHTSAELVLKNLLISGQCFDARMMEPVNGLQLILVDGTEGEKKEEEEEEVEGGVEKRHHSDTLVMQNNAYFQLRADPGLWKVKLAEGRARELYEVVSEDEEEGGVLKLVPGQELVVAKRDFSNSVETLKVQKQAGKEDVPLLDEISQEEEGGWAGGKDGMWSSLSNLWKGKAVQNGKEGDGKEEEEDETVHVFSLATGHLYERMLKIMMLSVSKRTSVPVKFWLLENFLSPAFKTAALTMAKHYGFQVEFITYKWPDWLRQQTEKQRIIWGYKILFLDVLFPLSVKKIIYVDADQVLRADLKELWELDLKGRPYGYTPFCTSRNETLGFQFWRSGYWANHLRGRPYHISALYVVDLVRFRLMGVGDKLRAVYDQLSRDPASLANLDQDLPNYTQHMIPIYSLPQEWLWCETWCSDESKARAKTIDLCNSPLAKENKLHMARRVISGPLFNESWVELDEEVKALVG